MRRDATLDEFVGSDAESGVDESDEESEVNGPDAQSAADDPDVESAVAEANIESASDTSTTESADRDADEEGSTSRDAGVTVVPTSAWTPEGAPCAACGAVVERRWRQDGALVCPDCKTWEDS